MIYAYFFARFLLAPFRLCSTTIATSNITTSLYRHIETSPHRNIATS
ncbi:MAG: hypothetical protein IPN94_00835 [Sphingobacteriales bacterium]|nr:hypothetical protein [Sphingobacteriales bacterium]